MNRRRGVLDRQLLAIATQQDGIGCQSDGAVFRDGSLCRIVRDFACGPVNDAENFRERPADGFCLRPAGDGLGGRIQIAHIARQIGTQYRITNRVERYQCALPLLEQGIFGVSGQPAELVLRGPF